MLTEAVPVTKSLPVGSKCILHCLLNEKKELFKYFFPLLYFLSCVKRCQTDYGRTLHKERAFPQGFGVLLVQSYLVFIISEKKRK